MESAGFGGWRNGLGGLMPWAPAGCIIDIRQVSAVCRPLYFTRDLVAIFALLWIGDVVTRC